MAETMKMDHGQGVSDYADLEGRSQGTVSSATNAAQSGALAEGIYDVWCDQDSYIKVDQTANDVTTGTGYLLRQGNTIPILVRKNSKIGAIMSTTAGILYYHQVR